MEFGRVETPINGIDHILPADGGVTANILGGTPANCTYHVGLSRWGQKAWCGTLYPEKTREKDFLSHYAKHFDSIELNATFFSLPSSEMISRWNEQVELSGNREFLFMPKASKEVTHSRQLRDCLPQTQKFLDAVSNFGDRLGPIFFQMGDFFAPRSFDDLKSFVINLPKGYQYFFEVRNAQWYSDEIDRGRYFDLLAGNNVGSIISDTSGRRDCVHMELSTRELFLRFVGNGGEYWASDFARIDAWVERIGTWAQRGLQKVYFIAHQYDEAYSPQLASYVIDRLNEKLGAGLKPLGL